MRDRVPGAVARVTNISASMLQYVRRLHSMSLQPLEKASDVVQSRRGKKTLGTMTSNGTFVRPPLHRIVVPREAQTNASKPPCPDPERTRDAHSSQTPLSEPLFDSRETEIDPSFSLSDSSRSWQEDSNSSDHAPTPCRSSPSPLSQTPLTVPLTFDVLPLTMKQGGFERFPVSACRLNEA